MVAHVLESTLGTNVVLVVSSMENAIFDLGRHKTTSLSIHGFRSQGGSHQKHLLIREIELLLGKIFLRFRSKFSDSNLDTGILLRIQTFSRQSIVIQAWLTVLFRVDGVSFTKLDLTTVSQSVHLPSHESIKVGIGIGGDKTTSPVDSSTKRSNISLHQLREKFQPMVRVSKLGNFFPR